MSLATGVWRAIQFQALIASLIWEGHAIYTFLNPSSCPRYQSFGVHSYKARALHEHLQSCLLPHHRRLHLHIYKANVLHILLDSFTIPFKSSPSPPPSQGLPFPTLNNPPPALTQSAQASLPFSYSTKSNTHSSAASLAVHRSTRWGGKGAFCRRERADVGY